MPSGTEKLRSLTASTPGYFLTRLRASRAMVIVEGYPTPAVAANLQPFACGRYLINRTRTQGYTKNGQIRDEDHFYRRLADSIDGSSSACCHRQQEHQDRGRRGVGRRDICQ